MISVHTMAVPLYLVVGDGENATRHQLGSVDLTVSTDMVGDALRVVVDTNSPVSPAPGPGPSDTLDDDAGPPRYRA